MSAKASTTVMGRVKPDYRRHERLKAEWLAEHPEATAREYEAAMLALAKDCGV